LNGEYSKVAIADLNLLEEKAPNRMQRWLHFWRIFIKSPAALFALILILMIILLAILAPVISPYPPDQQVLVARMKPPMFESAKGVHLLGTDGLGRDILSRIIFGSRVSLLIGVMSVVVAGTVGVVLGLFAGYFGGWVDVVIMRWTDVQLAIPFLVMALAVVAALGSGLVNIILVLGITGWVQYARIVRGETLRVREEEFVIAAKSIGVSEYRIIFRHILPNVTSSIIVMASLQIARFILMEASLSFLGLGVPVEIPTWGRLVADGRDYLSIAPWISTIPGVVIFVTVLCINIIGDRLRDMLDPRFRKIAERVTA
jgi:peptide/nickel transport system permease protein